MLALEDVAICVSIEILTRNDVKVIRVPIYQDAIVERSLDSAGKNKTRIIINKKIPAPKLHQTQ